jgi:Ca-activated chloride channel family protein
MTRTPRPPRSVLLGLLLLLGLARCAAYKSDPPSPQASPVPEERSVVAYDGKDPVAPPRPGASEPSEDTPFGEVPVVAHEAPSSQMYFRHWGTNPTLDTRAAPLSTFSIDVDTAAYSLTRAYLSQGTLPPDAAVRVEEVVNAFDYAYEAPTEATFTLVGEAVPSPSRPGYHFLHLGLKAREVTRAQRQPASLVFVIDVSGSMAQGGRLELVKRALTLLVEQLDARDRVGIVVYGSTPRALLEPTIATDRARIRAAIEDLAPEGSTYVQAGLELAYRMAASMPGAAHKKRLVLCSDGVANVGLTDGDAIVQAVRREAAQGVTLSAVGFGMGNYNDALMERLAQLGDGNYAYVDRESEARRVFVEQLTGTLEVMAADTKLQVELDPRYVLRYRLVGYENRVMAARDFRDDAKDAGEVGAGHAVTAIYELKLAPAVPRDAQLGVVRIRYKTPGAQVAQELERPISAALVRATLADASPAVRLSVAAAGFAEKLRGSYWARGWTYPALARVLAGLPPAWRTRADIAELASLVVRAEQLDRRGDRFEDEAPRASMGYDEVPVVAGR